MSITTAAPSLNGADPTARQSAAVRVDGVVKRFGAREVLKGLDFEIGPSEFVALLGPSGPRQDDAAAAAGRARAGAGRRDRRPRVALDRLPGAAPAAVAEGLEERPPRPAEGEAETALSALREVGLANHADAWPVTLSGGEAQRTALARALVREPQLLLLDEPFAALDALTRIRMHALVRALWEAHRPAVLIVTHDVDEALALADRVTVMNAGRISLDLPIPDAARTRGSAAFERLRERLLGELGVNAAPTEEPAA